MTENKRYDWKNYGDVNPLEHGGFFVKKDIDIENVYDFIEVVNMQEAVGDEGYMVSIGAVDVSDDWIEWEALNDSCGDDEGDMYRRTQNAVWYYGVENFGGHGEIIQSREDVITLLEQRGIETETF